MEEFSEGQIVELKSGGPEMTISSIEGENCYCVWFDSKNELKSNTFKKVILVSAI